MNTVSKMACLVLHMGETDESGETKSEEIGALSIEMSLSSKDAKLADFDNFANMIISAALGAADKANAKTSVNDPTDEGASSGNGHARPVYDPTDPNAAVPDPFGGRSNGLTAVPGETDAERMARHGAERRRQSGYNDAKNGLTASQPGDRFYMMGWNKYKEQSDAASMS